MCVVRSKKSGTIRAIALCMFIQLIASLSVNAQFTNQVVNSTGGTKEIKTDFILDWSVGEMTSVETYYGTSNNNSVFISRQISLTTGFLQLFDNFHFHNNPAVSVLTYDDVRLYPVPTTGILNVECRQKLTGNLVISVFDPAGAKIDSRKAALQFSDYKQTWDFSGKAAGTYFINLQLVTDKGVVKSGTFKFIKL